MDSLTNAELASYPGDDPTEKAYAHHTEHARLVRPTRPRRIDLRPFPGKHRQERMMHWLRAHFPRSQSWSEQALAELAEKLAAECEIVD